MHTVNRVFFSFFVLFLCIFMQNTLYAATSSTTQSSVQNSGIKGIDSLPGTEIKPEDIQKHFPAPLKGDAKSIPLRPDAAPIMPALPIKKPISQNPTIPTVQKPSSSPLLPKIPNSSDSLPDFLTKNTTSPDTAKQSHPKHLPLSPLPLAGQTRETANASSPSVEQMVGQMIMAGFTGADLQSDAPILKLIKDGKVGGVYLEAIPAKTNENSLSQQNHAPLAMTSSGHKNPQAQKAISTIKVPLGQQGNIASPAQVRVLIATLQRALPTDAPKLWIGVEHEGGAVQSLRKDLGFDGLAAAAHLGQGSVENTEIAARSAGLEMASLGINFVLGPAGDVNVNPLSENIGKRFRSFGPNAEQVAAHVAAFNKGLTATKTLACIRNFPGTGSVVRGFATASSDGTPNFMESIPDMSASWQERELRPYAKNIKNIKAIQPALIYNRKVDSLHPVPLSSIFLGQILREQLGFTGLILSQDLRNLQPFFSLEESILQSVLAGSDVLLITEPAASPTQEGLPGLGNLGVLGGSKTKVIQEILGAEANNAETDTKQAGKESSPEALTKALLQQNLGKVLPGAFQADIKAKPTAGIATQATLVYETLLRLVKSGRIPEARIRQSWQRIQQAKDLIQK